jgi:hypothetical protein
MRTTIAVDDHLFARAKRRAAARGQTLGAYIEDAIRRELTTAAAPAAPPAPVSLPVFPGRGLRPGIDPDSNRDLFDALDQPDGGLGNGQNA